MPTDDPAVSTKAFNKSNDVSIQTSGADVPDLFDMYESQGVTGRPFGNIHPEFVHCGGGIRFARMSAHEAV